VRQLAEFNSEVEVHDALGVLALKIVKEELEKKKRDANILEGMHPDGDHCLAQVCLRGHVSMPEIVPAEVFGFQRLGINETLTLSR
jgi:hypothetical protein